MNLYDEAGNIINRVTGFIASTKTFSKTVTYLDMSWALYEIMLPVFIVNPSTMLPFLKTETLEDINNYYLQNPVTLAPVHIGKDSRFFSYALKELAEKRANVYLEDKIIQRHNSNFLPPGQLRELNINSTIKPSWDAFEAFLTTWNYSTTSLADLVEAMLLTPVLFGAAPMYFGLPIEAIIDNRFFIGLCTDLAIMSDTWSHENIYEITKPTKYNSPATELIYCVLNDASSLYMKETFETLLMDAPCTGPNEQNNTWNTINYLTKLKQSTDNNDIEFNGIDYCFMYNLYRYVYKNSIQSTLKPFEEQACPCTQNSVLEYASNIYSNATYYDQTQTIYRRYPEYLNYQNGPISVKEFITKDIQVGVHENNNNLYLKALNIHTDAMVCVNSIDHPSQNLTQLSLKKWGRINIGNESGNPSSLTFRKSTTFIIGDNQMQSPYDICELHIYNNSKLVIQKDAVMFLLPLARVYLHGNAQIIIENGGKIYLSDLVEIQLQDYNSHIDIIGGGLHLYEHATFKPTGLGYVYFYNNPSNYYAFTCDAQARFIIQGNNIQHDRFISEGAWFTVPDNLSYFEISHAKVRLHKTTAINCGVPIKLDYVKVTKPDNSVYQYGHNGIHVYGQSDPVTGQSAISISYVWIEHGKNGIFVNTWPGAPPTALSHIDIRNCRYSLQSSQTGLILSNVTLKNNLFGWTTYAMSLPSKVIALNAENNESYGINYIGSKTSPLYLTGSNVNNNGFDGLLIGGNCSAYLSCNNIIGNNGSGIFAVAGASLFLDEFSGNNNISLNSNSGIRFNKIRIVSLNNGSNYLNNLPYSIAGTINGPSTCYQILPAHNNQWNYSVSEPIQFIDYAVYEYCQNAQNNFMYYPLFIEDTNPSQYIGCDYTSEIPANSCDDCRYVTIESTTKRINEWATYLKSITGLDSTSQNLLALNIASKIITDHSTNLTNDEKFIVYDIARLAGLAYGSGIYLSEIPVPRIAHDTGYYYKDKYMALNNKIVESLGINNSNLDEFDRVISKASVYGIATNYDSVSVVLLNLDSLSSNTLNQIKDHWYCVNEIQRMIKDSVIHREEFLDYIENCISGFRYSGNDEIAIYDKLGLEKNNSFTLYPNPAQEAVHINTSCTNCILRVVDVQGKVITTQQLTNSNTTLSTAGFAPGIYLLELHNERVVERKKLVVSNN